MSSSSLARRTRRGAVATVVAGTALALVGQDLIGATPAQASLTGPGVDEGERVTVSHDADSVAVHGYPEGTPLVVEVLRRDPDSGEDLVLGRASGPARLLEDGGPGLEVNRGPAEVAARPGDCWDVQTPDIRPGDRLVVTTPEDSDEVTVDDLRWTGAPFLDPATGDVLVAGVARYADGEPIPVTELSADPFANDTGGYLIDPDEVVATDPDGGFQVRYRTPFAGTRNDEGLTLEQRQAVLLGNGHGIGHEEYAEPLAETTPAETTPAATVLGEAVLDEAVPDEAVPDGEVPAERPDGTTPDEAPAGTELDRPQQAGTELDPPRPVAIMRVTGPAETPGPAEGCEASPATGDTPLPADEGPTPDEGTVPAEDTAPAEDTDRAEDPADTVPPQVGGQSPAPGGTGVAPDAPVTAVFSEDVTGVDAGSLTLTGPGGAVAAEVAYDAATRTASLLPSAPLAWDSTYTAAAGGITDSAGLPLATTTWTFTTAPAPDTTAPAPTAVTPSSGASAVALDAPVTATFSEPVTGVDGSTLTLTGPDGAVPATVTYDPASRVATLDPAAPLTPEAGHVATVTEGIRDAAGHALARTSWTFTTGPAPDTAVPTVTGATPTDGTGGVPPDATVTATFSEPVTGVDPATMVLRPEGGGEAVPAAVRYDAGTRAAVLDPSVDLAPGTRYTAGLGGEIEDPAGNRLAPVSWSFTTAAPAPTAGTAAPTTTDRTPAPDRVRPTITGRSTGPGATGVAPDATVGLVFSEPVTGLGRSSVTLRSARGDTVPVELRIDPPTASVALVPTADLAPGTRYTVSVGTAVRDAAGNRFTGASWSFTTAAAPVARSAVTGR
ncbi:Ig-like domain-containing protein [Geodermatophilus sp. SYSU D00703]